MRLVPIHISTSPSLQHFLVLLDNCWDNQALDLNLLLTLLQLWRAYPFQAFTVYEYDFALARGEKVPDDKVVRVAIEALSTFREKHSGVCFKLFFFSWSLAC